MKRQDTKRPETARRVRRSQERARSCGAAFTEMLILTPLLVLISMATLYTWSAYSTKMRTMQVSRRASWTPAISGCKTTTAVAGAEKSAGKPDASLEGTQGQLTQARQIATSPNVRAPFENLARNPSSMRAQKAAEEGHSTWQNRTYVSEGSVLCNEVPRSITAQDEKQEVDRSFQRYVSR